MVGCLRQAICLDLRTVSRGEKLIEGGGGDREGEHYPILNQIAAGEENEDKTGGLGVERERESG